MKEVTKSACAKLKSDWKGQNNNLRVYLVKFRKQEEINKQIPELEKQINIEKDQIEDFESLYKDIDLHIEKLQKQNQEYNQLLGSVKHKNTVLTKIQKNSDEIIIKSEIIDNL